jgi:hypothetical protein
MNPRAFDPTLNVPRTSPHASSQYSPFGLAVIHVQYAGIEHTRSIQRQKPLTLWLKSLRFP